MNLFRKKGLGQVHPGLNRHLRLWDLIILGIGAMVGTGIFTITGTAAANLAGPALIISNVIAAFCVGLSALFFAEFASRIPSTGGAYSYLYAIFWRVSSLDCRLVDCDGIYDSCIRGSFRLGCVFQGLVGQSWLEPADGFKRDFDPAKGTYVDLLPILVMVLVTALVLMNAKAVLRFNSLLVLLKFSALALFILVGIFHLNPGNWANFAPYGFGEIYGGQTGIMAGASLMFFAFLGFESISMAVDEIKEPQKNVPRGIVLSLLITTVLYILVTLVLTGMVPFKNLNVEDAVAFALRQVGAGWAGNYVSLVAILTLITVCISMTFALSRMIYSLARDGLLPKAMKQLDPKTRIPKMRPWSLD